MLNYLALAMLEPGDEVAYGWPSFPVYPINAAKMGAIGVPAPLAGSSLRPRRARRGDHAAHEDRLRDEPEQPDRRHGAPRGARALPRRAPPHVLPVIDEAYFEFVDDPDYPDALPSTCSPAGACVVLRTFSKIYGLAGLRVGWGACRADVAEALSKVKNAFDISQPAQDAAVASLGQDAELARRRDETREGRERLHAGPRRARARAARRPSRTSWRCRWGTARRSPSALERRGVIVRPLGGFGDPTSIRISVGLPDEIEVALRELGAVLAAP